MKHLFLLTALAILLGPASKNRLVADENSPLRAGAAAVDISPQSLPAIMNGGFLQNRANRVVDPLHARALVINSSQETIAIVIVDSCMFPRTICDRIKRLAKQKTGIRTDRILISATHTHTAPSVMERCLGTGADEAYVEFVPDRVAQAIAVAQKNLQPAKMGWAIVDGTDLTNCRRWITRSDRMGTDPFGGQTVRAMMHPGYQNPSYTSPAGPIDPWLSILSIVSAKDEKPICLMANLSMHYFGGPGFSADYFGETARVLEAKFGKKTNPPFVGIMSQGTSGDLHWMDYSQPRRSIGRQQYSASVADRVIEAWKNIQHRSDLSLAMAEKRISIERRIPSRGRLEWARPINAARGNLPPRNRTEVYAQQANWIHENPKTEVVLQAVRIGELGITAIPNEVYGITGLKLKRQSPLKATFNLELANGAAGYIPPPEQHRLGGYTTWPARTAGLAEQAEPLIVETLLGLLEKVTDRSRRPILNPKSPYSQAVINQKPLAYWRLDDMTSTLAKDEVGENHANYHGAVALFLPESARSKSPQATFDNPNAYGNRCIYLAGGHLSVELKKQPKQHSLILRFWNAIPPDVRDTTGVLYANETETLLINGRAEAENSGKLVLKVGGKSWTGKTSVSNQHWQQVVVTKAPGRIRVYLDNHQEPEIDAEIASSTPCQRWLFGSDGNPNSAFDGKIDEVALFDHVLSSADIFELYDESGLIPPSLPKPTVILGPKPSDAETRKKYADTVLSSKPVAYWRLHDRSSQTANDSTGGLAAKYERGSAPLQPSDTRPNFSGGRVKSQIGKLGNTYSIELWFRNELPFDARPVTAYLFSRAEDGIEGADGDNLGIGGTHSHSGRLIVFNGNSRNQLVAGRTRLAPGSWSHVVMVRQNQKITVYLNGDPQPEIAAELPIGYPQDCKDILFGGRADNFANLQGMLEEIALYDRPLKPEEVVDHYRAAGVKALKRPTAARPPAPSEPTPTEPAEALKTIQVRDGFKVELIAAEPLVKDPVAIDWGPDGKLWVVEMADYPLGIDGKGKPGGRVRFLEDTDKNGKYDKSTLFAEGLSYPTGILCWDQGVLVTAAPQIVYLEDSTGDGMADIRRVLYSGFLEGNQQLRVNGLRWGLDNWVYCASGSHHGGYGKDSQIVSHLTKTQHHIGSRDFRIRPDNGAIDPQSGPSQYGRNRDDWGNWFGVQNSHPLWHYVLADHHIRRNPHFAPPDPRQQVITPSNPPVFPASKLQKRYHSFSQSGRFTSACSAMIYRDNYLFERGPEQHAFTCEPFHNLVQHNLISGEGTSFKFRRDPAESKTDFFASQDRWCRPVMARTGPDGALWVVDMYRYMIEHPEWLPQNGKNELRPWYRSGEDRGRIYRVVRTDQPPRQIPEFTDASLQRLISALESPNGWQRDTAQRMLVRRQDLAAVEPLFKTARLSEIPTARLHALWTLEGLGKLPVSTLETAFNDRHVGVRRNAVRIAAGVKVDVMHLERLINDPEEKVRLELATTLGYYDSPRAAKALGRLAVQESGNRFLKAAVMSSLNPENVFDVLSAAIQAPASSSSEAVSDLIEQAVAMGGKDTIGRVIQAVTVKQQDLSPQQRFESLESVLKAFSNRQWTLEDLPDSARKNILNTVRQARKTAINTDAEINHRTAAIRLLGRTNDRRPEDFQLMQVLLGPRSPVAIQRAVVRNLATANEPFIADILLANWNSHSPEIRNQVLDVLASRKQWAENLRNRLETNSIRATELNASIRQRLLNMGENSAAWKNALAIKPTKSRAQVIRDFQPALNLEADSKRGEAIFRKTCINCHKLDTEGHEVGPQLSSITNKTKEAIFSAILDPNASVDAKYFDYLVATTDGRVLNGMLQTETGISVTLLAAGGKRVTILRRDIEKLKARTKSVMPEGLEEGMSKQDLADLIQFVRKRFR